MERREVFKKCDEYLCMKDLYDLLKQTIEMFKNNPDCNREEIEFLESLIDEKLAAMINRIAEEIRNICL